MNCGQKNWHAVEQICSKNRFATFHRMYKVNFGDCYIDPFRNYMGKRDAYCVYSGSYSMF